MNFLRRCRLFQQWNPTALLIYQLSNEQLINRVRLTILVVMCILRSDDVLYREQFEMSWCVRYWIWHIRFIYSNLIFQLQDLFSFSVFPISSHAPHLFRVCFFGTIAGSSMKSRRAVDLLSYSPVAPPSARLFSSLEAANEALDGGDWIIYKTRSVWFRRSVTVDVDARY